MARQVQTAGEKVVHAAFYQAGYLTGVVDHTDLKFRAATVGRAQGLIREPVCTHAQHFDLQPADVTQRVGDDGTRTATV